MTEFLNNDELYLAYQELIYNYPNSEWIKYRIKVKKYEKKYKADLSIPRKVRQSVWKAFNPGKLPPEGKRRYHPMFFQGSLEEKRLDRVLHHFDMIAYYWLQGTIHIQDISGVAGYHLGVIGTRRVIRYYLRLNDKRWPLLPYGQAVGGEPPFTQLADLLKELEKWQRKRKRA